jgi:hypothetical protein
MVVTARKKIRRRNAMSAIELAFISGIRLLFLAI